MLIRTINNTNSMWTKVVRDSMTVLSLSAVLFVANDACNANLCTVNNNKHSAGNNNKNNNWPRRAAADAADSYMYRGGVM